MRIAGLNHTYYGGCINPDYQECYSYVFGKEWRKAQEMYIDIVHGAGGIVSTPFDLTVFIKSLFAGQLINKDMLSIMTSTLNGFGMGIHPSSFCNRNGFGHHGAIDAFGAHLWFCPDEDVIIAYCSNGYVLPIPKVLLVFWRFTLGMKAKIRTKYRR